MLEVVNLFRDKGTLDELGLGTIRDAFADHFFPGISTIHTRGRYFLFVPWIFLRIERERVAAADVQTQARSYQAALVRSLQRGGEGEAQGVIGIQAGSRLKRYGIWRFPGSLAQYYATPTRVRALRDRVFSDDDELVEQAKNPGWDPGLPDAPVDFLERTSMALRPEDADYLRERIVGRAPQSLLAICLDGSRQLARIDAPWNHPGFADFPHPLQLELHQAHCFSVVAQGGTLLYHLMLAEQAEVAGMHSDGALIEKRRGELEAWWREAENLLSDWRVEDLWQVLQNMRQLIPWPTQKFVSQLAVAIQEHSSMLADHHDARALVSSRELQLKGGLARLTHRRALQSYSGLVNVTAQTYRWPNVKTIVSDIHHGLR
jgi:hypothetical protein